MDNSGWIKIHRKMLDWEWYDDSNTFRLFLHLLLKANHKPKKYRGVLINTGQVMTGLNLLSKQTGLSIQNIRTALGNLELTNEVTNKTSSKGSIIQIVKYKDYQVLTSKQQTDNKQLTTNKKYISKDIYPSFSDFWELYDKKVGKELAIKKWNKLKQSDKEKIIKVIPNYILNNPEKQFRKNPSSYLNQKSWNDELIIKTKKQIIYGENPYKSQL